MKFKQLAFASAMCFAFASPASVAADATGNSSSNLRFHGGDEIVLQGFHWNSMRDANNGNWYDTMASMSQEIADAGITTVWMPPPWQDWSHWEGGGKSGGGEGYFWHNFDLNSQYGSASELSNATSSFANKGVKVIFDIVPNHRNKAIDNGGWPYTGSHWRYGGSDDGDGFISGDADLNTSHTDVYNAIKGAMIDLKDNYNASGFRFDFVRGYAASRVDAWMTDVDDTGICVGELWKDPITQTQLNDWSDAADCMIFDFELKQQINTGDISKFKDGLNANTAAGWRERAVTVVDNHDTGYSPGQYGGQAHWPAPSWIVEYAYAYTLLSPGTPSVYWQHLFDWDANLTAHIKNLIDIRKQADVRAWSNISFHGYTGVAATVTGENHKLVLSIGSNLTDPTSVETGSFELVASGVWGKVWKEVIDTGPVVLTNVYLRGTTGTDPFGLSYPMNQVADNTWELEVDLVTDTPTRFQFDTSTDWSGNYGDITGDGVADSGCSSCDIEVAEAGTYRITLYDDTLAYTVNLLETESQPVPDTGTETEENTPTGHLETVIFIKYQSSAGQDMFVRGGIDHAWSDANRGTTCSSGNTECRIDHVILNSLNNYTNAWEQNDSTLDWYGIEPGQGAGAEGTPLEWTTNDSSHYDSANDKDGTAPTAYEDSGVGYHSGNTYGPHYWLYHATLDCSDAVEVTASNGQKFRMFEMKAFVKGGAGWESDRNVDSLDYNNGAASIPVFDDTLKNHFVVCGKINYLEFDANWGDVWDL